MYALTRHRLHAARFDDLSDNERPLNDEPLDSDLRVIWVWYRLRRYGMIYSYAQSTQVRAARSARALAVSVYLMRRPPRRTIRLARQRLRSWNERLQESQA